MSHLRSLHLREAKSHAVVDVVAALPHLVTLKTHYIPQTSLTSQPKPAGRLRCLEVHISGGQVLNMWDWILILVPHTSSLESLIVRDPFVAPKSNAYRFPHEWAVPSTFLCGLAETHGSSLRHLILDAAHLTVEDLAFVCARFVRLEWLTAHVEGCNMVRGQVLAPCRLPC